MPGSYRDVLAHTERKRPDGSPVWPLRDEDLSSRVAARKNERARAA